MQDDMATSIPQPRGWQAVYTLVQDSEKRVLREVADVKARVDGIGGQMDTHLLAHATHDAALAAKVEVQADLVKAEVAESDRKTRKREMIRTIVQTVIPVIAIVLAILGYK